MPLPLTPGDRKLLLIGGGVFIAMICAALLLVQGGTDRDIPSAYSTASGGCKAAYLLLQESGYRVQTWERPVGELSGGKGKILIIAEPGAFPDPSQKQKLEQFLKSGGRVIAAGRFAAFYLPQDGTAFDPVTGNTWKQFPALAPSPITHAAPEITLAPRAHWRSVSGAVGLYGEPDRPVVVEYKIGEGGVLWLADATPLTNAGITQTGNLEFLLAAVGERGENQILWDEFVHGYAHDSAIRPSSRLTAWIALQLGLFALAILLTYARRSGPVWVPEGEIRLSPLEFVRTLGSLYEHANAGSVAVQISYQRFRYLLTRRLGLSVNTGVDHLSRAVRDRGLGSETDFAGTLSECESCRYDPNIEPSAALHLVQTLFDYAAVLKLTRSGQREKKTWKQS